MATEKNANVEPLVKTATEKQIALIQQLYSELSYERQYSERELLSLEQDETQKHIEVLLSLKRGKDAVKANQNHSNGFDKICFAMLYKLVWRAMLDGAIKLPPGGGFAKDYLLAEYKAYKEIEAFAKEQLAKEAIQ